MSLDEDIYPFVNSGREYDHPDFWTPILYSPSYAKTAFALLFFIPKIWFNVLPEALD